VAGLKKEIPIMVVAMRKLFLASALMVLVTTGWSASQAAPAIAQAQTIQNKGSSTQASSQSVLAKSDEVSCNSSGALNTTLYKNDLYGFIFQCPEGLKARFYLGKENIGILVVVADRRTSITLTVNGPAVPLDSMQKTTLDQSVTINGIAMRKRLISDPVIGNPNHEDQEIIYDFSHGKNTFTWWAVLRKNETINYDRVEQIIRSFKFTD
jgi:hypothetical protein